MFSHKIHTYLIASFDCEISVVLESWYYLLTFMKQTVRVANIVFQKSLEISRSV